MKALLPLLAISLILVGAACGQAPPATFSHDVAFNSETVTVNFSLFSCRGPHFEVLEQQADGSLITHAHGTVRTYIGTVTGKPGAIAAGIQREDGSILARVTFEDGSEWVDNGAAVSQRSSTVTPRFPEFTLRPGGAGSTLYAADIGIDLPYDQVISSGGTSETALEIAEFSMMSLNTIYLRDTALVNLIERVIVRLDDAQDPYDGMTTTGQLLTEVGNQWNNVLPSGDHDLGLVASTQVGGGLAQVGVVGTGYSANGSNANGDFSVVGRHELGHNWSLGHFDGGTPEGATINSGNSLGKMSAPEIEKVLSHRDARLAFLDNLGNTAPPLPPRAADDRLVVEPGSGATLVSVLENDNDVNGDTLSLTSFDSLSELGAIISAGGANQLSVTAPADFLATDDSFSYRISDPAGFQSSARVHLRTLMAGDVAGHWTFEKSTTQALDSSSKGRHGPLVGDAQISDGVLMLDGAGDYALVGAPDVETNTVTFAAMIYRDGEPNDFTGIINSRSGSNATGLNFGFTTELRYHWVGSDWQFGSGLNVPNQTWTFVALVIEPDKATFYLNDGSGMQTSVRNAPHAAKLLGTGFRLGHEPLGNRYLPGMMDNARIVTRALSASEIADLAAGGFGACDPTPGLAEQVSSDYIRLSWNPSPAASAQRLYFSSDYTELRDATVGGAADLGTTALDFHELSNLAPGTYYWRIDTTEPSGVVKGNLWTFTLIPSGLVARWPLDETTGTAANELINARHGTIIGNPLLGQDGASIHTATCHCHDGNSDYVEVPYAADLNPSEFTVSLWARVDGGNGTYRSAITSRDDSPARGYILYATNSNVWSFWIGNGGGWSIASSPDTIINGQWYHLAATYGDGTSKLYVDGTLKASRGASLARNEARPIRIGSGNTEGSHGFDFNGCLDEVKLWNRSLSETEIGRLSAYHRWIHENNLTGADAEPNARPGANGLSNLINYALDHSPSNMVDTTPSFSATGQAEFLLPTLLRSDLVYVLQTGLTPATDDWTDIATKSPEQPWMLNSTMITFAQALDGRQRLRSIDLGEERRFWRLLVRLD